MVIRKEVEDFLAERLKEKILGDGDGPDEDIPIIVISPKAMKVVKRYYKLPSNRDFEVMGVPVISDSKCPDWKIDVVSKEDYWFHYDDYYESWFGEFKKEVKKEGKKKKRKKKRS